MRRARQILNHPVGDCRLVMVFDGRWKYIHAEGFRPMLYDLAADPQELVDLGDAPEHEDQRQRLETHLNRWARGHHTRVTVPDKRITGRKGGELSKGVIIGFWNTAELEEALERGSSGN
jgi:arylsulfatase A-like enzyme